MPSGRRPYALPHHYKCNGGTENPYASLFNRDSCAIGRHISTPHAGRRKSLDSARLQFYTVGTSCSRVPCGVIDFTAEVNVPYNSHGVKHSCAVPFKRLFHPRAPLAVDVSSSGAHIFDSLVTRVCVFKRESDVSHVRYKSSAARRNRLLPTASHVPSKCWPNVVPKTMLNLFPPCLLANSGPSKRIMCSLVVVCVIRD